MCSRRASVCFGKQQIDGLHQLALGLTTDAVKKEPLSVVCIVAKGPFRDRPFNGGILLTSSAC